MEATKSAIASSSFVLRVLLPSFGSPAWGVPDQRSLTTGRPDLSAFLTRVRCLARKSQTVALVTVQSQLLSEVSWTLSSARFENVVQRSI